MANKNKGLLGNLFKNIHDKSGRTLGEALDEGLDKLSPEKKKAIKNYINTEAEKELSIVPKIAIIGNTGVGKSSTINALFGTKLPISHTQACTKEAVEISLDGKLVKGTTGNIILYDMPGLGEDLDADEQHKATYRKIIAECDVAVWILSAVSRAIAFDQMMIRDVVVPSKSKIVSRLVIGVNQIDLIQPGKWVEGGNVPDKKQKESIKERISDISEKLVKVIPGLNGDRIVPYSAIRRYHLVQLFEKMLKACVDDRAWVLNSRGSIADYTELIDPRILEAIKSREKGK